MTHHDSNDTSSQNKTSAEDAKGPSFRQDSSQRRREKGSTGIRGYHRGLEMPQSDIDTQSVRARYEDLEAVWNPGSEEEKPPSPQDPLEGQKSDSLARRPDATIQEDVYECLFAHPEIDAREIHVVVENGDMTLTGWVSTQSQKTTAEELLRTILDVKSITNLLMVDMEGAVPVAPAHDARALGATASVSAT